MRVVHLSSSDSGGAGRACVRLHKSLLDSGVDSIILTQNKTGDSLQTFRLAQTKMQKIIEKIRPALSQLPLMLYPNRHKDIFSPQLPFFIPRNKTLLNRIKELKPDIVHLHWIESGFINIKDLSSIDAPILWSLHDANPYTGGCHIVATACIGVSIGCQKCPLLGSNTPYDISYFSFKRKSKTYNKIKNFTINGLSTWIAKCAKDSALFREKTIINLPNPIDTNAFAPIPKDIARSLLHLQQTSKIIAFGAINPTSTARKGYGDLKGALRLLTNKSQVKLIVFGAMAEEQIEGIETLYLGHLSDDIALKIVYSLADVVFMPSHTESFGQVALESLSCGTPVVAYNTSGLRDIISHKYNGYLADFLDVKDLANGLNWILNLDESAYQDLSINARNSVLAKFEAKKVAKQYIDLYTRIANGGGQNKYFLRLLLLSLLSNYAKASPKDFIDSAKYAESAPLKHDKNITKETYYIGFGAIDNVLRKGYNELLEALKLLTIDYQLVVFGANNNSKSSNNTHFLGRLNDDETLRLAYNSCDIFVVPSLAENLSNAIMEALSCGIPVIAFDIGGNGDMIAHKINGYLAKDVKDLAKGIEWSLDSANYTALSINARNGVLAKFEAKKVVQKYISQYQKMLNGGGHNEFRFTRIYLIKLHSDLIFLAHIKPHIKQRCVA